MEVHEKTKNRHSLRCGGWTVMHSRDWDGSLAAADGYNAKVKAFSISFHVFLVIPINQT